MSSDDTYMEWQPATIEEVKKIVQEDLAACDHEQIAAFENYAIEPYRAAIQRYGKDESVVVVAQRGRDVLYWEDVEEGFNLSPIASDGNILEHWCNQDRLGEALNVWIEGRAQLGRFGPATPVE